MNHLTVSQCAHVGKEKNLWFLGIFFFPFVRFAETEVYPKKEVAITNFLKTDWCALTCGLPTMPQTQRKAHWKEQQGVRRREMLISPLLGWTRLLLICAAKKIKLMMFFQNKSTFWHKKGKQVGGHCKDRWRND